MEVRNTTALEIEESLSGAVDTDVRVFVADVVTSSDTADRGIWHRVLGSLGYLLGLGMSFF